MGEMADYYNELDNFEETEPDPITCKVCGETNLYWADAKPGWFLVNEDDQPHTCKTLSNYREKFG